MPTTAPTVGLDQSTSERCLQPPHKIFREGLGLVTRVGEMHYRAPQDTFYIRPLLSRTREGDDLPNTDTQRVTQTEETGI